SRSLLLTADTHLSPPTTPPHPTPTLFPYTTLFRSRKDSPFPLGSIGRSRRFCAARQFPRAYPWQIVAHSCLASGRYRPEARQERSEEHTSELQSRFDLVCRLLLEKKKS